jgi:tRNA G10  N-methylase Trm11
LQDYGRSARVVPNKTPELSSAQVLHNKLTGERGWELLLIKDGQKTYVAQTAQIQDIEAYAARDQQRPKRDARVGMLPPKLAQIIINLAASPASRTLLDPFCGTGVILQEALLMGYDVMGTDLDRRMVDYTEANILWLRQLYPDMKGLTTIHQGDATDYKWPEGIDFIATETYLGRPFSAAPKPEVLMEVMRDVDTIHRKFLQNVSRQTKTGFTMCIAVPAWKTQGGFRRLPTLDRLEELGYTRQSFVHVKTGDLVYHRPEQIVARELVVLQRK